MKRLLILLSAAALLIGGNALAQNPDPDEICIFADTGCTENFVAPAFGAGFNAYVVLQNVSEPSGISGFEFCMCNDDGSPLMPPAGLYFVTGYSLPPGAVNVDTAPCFVVGLATPLAASPCITMVTVALLSFSQPPGTPWCFGVEPSNNPSIPGEMAYAAGEDPGHLLAMHPCVGPDAPSCYIFCVNSATNPVPTEDATWGSIKDLYR